METEHHLENLGELPEDWYYDENIVDQYVQSVQEGKVLYENLREEYEKLNHALSFALGNKQDRQADALRLAIQRLKPFHDKMMPRQSSQSERGASDVIDLTDLDNPNHDVIH